MQYFKREVEKDLYTWKKRRDNKGYKNLLVSGPKFVGKSTLIEKFARENYDLVIEIDCENKEHVDKFNKWEYEYDIVMAIEPLTQLFRRFDPNFIDSEKTAIIIKEIQFSSELYSYISQMTFILSSRIMITGSYLYLLYADRRVRNLGTEVMELRLNPLYFSEFAQAFGYEELYESVDLYGSSDPEKYNELHELFEKYLLCGGYPSVVQEYLLHNDIYFANKELERMHGLIVEDLSNACLPTVDICFLKTTIDATASLLLANKSNHQEFAKITDLLREMSIVENEASRKTLEHVIPWIFRTNLIGICGRALNCKYPFIRHLYKFYFSDVGLARWLIERTSKDRNALDVLSKNYVFNIINNYAYDFKFYPYFPVAATYNGGEIDFLFRNKKYRSEFAVDVIYSECSEKPTSSYTALKDGIVNRLVRFQGEGPFGKDGEIYTVPIYLIERFDFNIGGFRCPELSTLPTFLPGELDKSQR